MPNDEASEDQNRAALRKRMATVFAKLDALCNFSYTPRAVRIYSVGFPNDYFHFQTCSCIAWTWCQNCQQYAFDRYGRNCSRHSQRCQFVGTTRSSRSIFDNLLPILSSQNSLISMVEQIPREACWRARRKKRKRTDCESGGRRKVPSECGIKNESVPRRPSTRLIRGWVTSTQKPVFCTIYRRRRRRVPFHW